MIEWLCKGGDGTWQGFFARELRGDLFGACLTLSGFLYAAYTFIIVHMKCHVYESREYQQIFRQKKKADSQLKLWNPLQNLSRRLHRTIIVALVAAILQLTLGLIEMNWAASVCMGAFIWSVSELTRGIVIVHRNITDWLEGLGEPSSDGTTVQDTERRAEPSAKATTTTPRKS